MKSIQSNKLWKQVKEIKSSVARTSIPHECYKQSQVKNLFWYFFDLILFLGGLALVFLSSHLEFQLIGGVIAGVATAMLFVWAHDAAHGALFKNSKIAEMLGTIAMLPSLNVYRMWSFGHNKVHHGFASFSPIDWIWRPLTRKEYQSLSSIQRVLYRIERCFFTSAFHYLRRIWWEQMLCFNPGKEKQERRYYRNGKLIVLFYGLAMSVLAYIFAGGIVGVAVAVVVPFIVFNYFIAIIVYLHHTHPDIPFFDLKAEWSHSVGALYCSTIIHCSKLSRVLLHNIMIHVPHHLDPRIPFYNLPQAHQALKVKYGEYVHEYQFKLRYVLNIFKSCKLYDFESKHWSTFKEAKT
ncbi:fatty acid desaturase [Legionella bononiensis]|uniref:Fatty acid desaturase n=1 Tax=Legionella bononiensis TaxID=2793102 RepID=A0ABS1W783_9GAMM|nr:fatty acid desaturase [Legionella bononiensis]MBL7481317.1 fatty acid desaturase [Legionella bononiensis]MBL7525221.1 fatty acid desaturase [Legionella bononiensis]MBL7561404.1 fatty acid desaturase [Legionella bononiensis]